MSKIKKAKFRVGQVAVVDEDGRYFRIVRHGMVEGVRHYEVTPWSTDVDDDHCTRWMERELRPLTKREKGN